MNKLIKKALRLILPIVLGCFILYWVYRGFDFEKALDIVAHGTKWGWMFLSLAFGVLAQFIRGLRWKQTLEPLGIFPKTSECVNAIFVSYAASLVVPRMGEVSRCGILARYDKVLFSKSLGTVVTERLVDMLCIVLIAGVTVMLQLPVFRTFILQTGTQIPSFLHLVSSVWFYIILLCTLGVAILFYFLIRRFALYDKVKGVLVHVWEGVMSVRSVKNIPLFIGYSLAIWLSYFLHFYITFFCFSFTDHLSILAALVMFVGGTFAVIVPTPNGAGPWHFAIISMMMLYGVNATDAGIFALIVHGIQTFLVALLGIYGMAALSFANRTKKVSTQ